jgi:acyl carrier protein
VPVGVPGELFASGDCLARGYLDRPELTGERFIADPFDRTPGARMYRTGDLARYHPDGTIDFLGRADGQVKIRGFRVELGEIEAVLLQIPGVSEAVVVAREDKPGQKRLVAYVVPKTPGAISAEQLKTQLAAKLPAFMIPWAFMVMEKLPETPSGKLDRRALPVPEGALRSETSEYVAPRSPMEEELVGIWRELLSVDRVGVRDNFFELGGHSLLATQLASRVRRAYGVEIPLRSVFHAPTVEALSVEIVLRQAGSADSDELTRLLAEVEGAGK